MKKNKEELNKEIGEELIEELVQEENEVCELSARITELEEELAIAKNDYYKAYADAENTKKRLRQDFDTHNKYRLQSFALEILPAIDNLERALENTDPESSVYKGVEMIYKQLMESLRKEGVEEIVALKQPFDPNIHHAVMTEVVEGVEPGIVIEELQKGYKIKDRILRASLVKVSE